MPVTVSWRGRPGPVGQARGQAQHPLLTAGAGQCPLIECDDRGRPVDGGYQPIVEHAAVEGHEPVGEVTATQPVLRDQQLSGGLERVEATGVMPQRGEAEHRTSWAPRGEGGGATGNLAEGRAIHATTGGSRSGWASRAASGRPISRCSSTRRPDAARWPAGRSPVAAARRPGSTGARTRRWRPAARPGARRRSAASREHALPLLLLVEEPLDDGGGLVHGFSRSPARRGR